MNALSHSLRGFLNASLAFLYPEVCQLCGVARASSAECFLCAGCRSARFIVAPYCDRCGLPFEGAITTSFECTNCQNQDWHFSRARSAVIARGQVLEIIHRYKYQRALWFEPFLADLLIQQAGSEIRQDRWDFIVPVPLHPTKLREREFNQAERIARRLSVATRVPLNTRALRRVMPTRTQTLLSREERLANVRKAFVARAGEPLEGKRIVLVDDVFTTGATTGACAKVLRSAGAGEVCVWTVARGV
jgi:competence protein ComFC